MDDPIFASPIRPWARLFAFWFDMTVFFSPTMLLWHYWDGDLYFNFTSYMLGIPMALAKTIVVLPLIALCLSLTGTTPGKALLGTRIVSDDGGKIGFTRAYKRTMYAFWVGALGEIAPMGYVSLYFSFNRLRVARSAAWDQKYRTQALHEPYVPWRIAVYAVVFVACQMVEGFLLLTHYPELMELLYA